MGWFILCVVVVVVGTGVFKLYLEDQRLKRLQQLARKHGLHYHADDPFDIPHRYPFGLFKQGHSQEASNCFDGKYQNLHVILFDYKYRTGSGNHETTHTLLALLARLDICSPHLIIRPETVLNRFAAFFGFEDVKFESNEFNRAFNVRAVDKKFAYDICHGEMMEFLLRHPSMCWELGGEYLLLYESNKCTSDPVRLAGEFADRIPEYLRKEARP
jgi:hypothetical protein